MSSRFQHQPWYIKLWRYRWYLIIPYDAFTMWIRSNESFGVCWGISTGMAQVKMNWLYDWADVKDRLREKSRGESKAKETK